MRNLSDFWLAAAIDAHHSSDGVSSACALCRSQDQRAALDPCGSLARQFKLKRLKLYEMVGLPTETDSDIDDWSASPANWSDHSALSRCVPVRAKRNSRWTVRIRIDTRAGVKNGAPAERLKGRVEVRPTSPRWAWVEYMLSQGMSGGLALSMPAARRSLL